MMVKYYYTNAVMGERPKFDVPNPEFLKQLTPDGFQKLVDNFYEEIVNSEISHFFPDDEEELALIKKRNASYFMMICGGDDRYISKFGGDFDQIKTHEPFSIPNKARLEWLGCWEEVLKDIENKVDHEHIQSYWNWLEVFSKHIVNFETDRQTYEDKAQQGGCPIMGGMNK
jgi:hemoglobin